MAYKFNPFTGTFDDIESSKAGGSTGQIQFNSSGAFAGDVNLTWDVTTGLTLAKPFTNTTASAASTPAQRVTGTWFTGGTATTTKPQVLIEPAGATSTAWSVSGTGLGVNATSGFTGNLLDLQVNGSSRLSVSSSGARALNVIADNSYSVANILKIGSTEAGIRYYSTEYYTLSFHASNLGTGLGLSSGGVSVGGSLGFGTSVWNNIDVFLVRDASSTLAQRNGTAAQTSRLYNTYTDASNYERLSTTWSSNVCYTKPENAGTGSARLYVPVTGATTVAGLPAAATAGAGARAFVTDASATTFLSTAAGGGANKVPVVSDGTNWLIG